MKRKINILAGLLAVQIALFLYLTIGDTYTSGAPKSDFLLSLDWNKVGKITVEDSDKKTLEIVKKEGAWKLPSLFEFPVNENKMRETLEKLTTLKRSWPVGNTLVAAKQFEVVDDKFERRISFFLDGENVQTVFLGTSPSYRKVHVRANKEDHTYGVDFNAFDVPSDAKGWLDRDLYKLDRSKLSIIQLPGIVLKQDSGNFIIADLQTGQVTNTTESDSLVNKIINPRFDEVLGTSYEVGTQVYEYSVTTADNTTRKFTFSEMKQKSEPQKEPVKGKEEATEKPKSDTLVLKVSDFPFYFSVSKSLVDGIKEIDRAKLVKAEEKKEAQPEEKKS